MQTFVLLLIIPLFYLQQQSRKKNTSCIWITYVGLHVLHYRNGSLGKKNWLISFFLVSSNAIHHQMSSHLSICCSIIYYYYYYSYDDYYYYYRNEPNPPPIAAFLAIIGRRWINTGCVYFRQAGLQLSITYTTYVE